MTPGTGINHSAVRLGKSDLYALDYNDYNDYDDFNGDNEYNDYNDYRHSDLDFDLDFLSHNLFATLA